MQSRPFARVGACRLPGPVDAPSATTADTSVFAGNAGVGAHVGGSSTLDLGPPGKSGGGNSFLANLSGAIANNAAATVAAEQNWFGTADAKAISGAVDFTPFLTHTPGRGVGEEAGEGADEDEHRGDD